MDPVALVFGACDTHHETKRVVFTGASLVPFFSPIFHMVQLRAQSKQKEWNRARDVATHEGGRVYTRRVGRVRGRLER
jgi:hypothetical protein